MAKPKSWLMELNIAIQEADKRARTQGIAWYVVPFEFGFSPVSQRYLENVNPSLKDKCVYKVILNRTTNKLLKERLDG